VLLQAAATAHGVSQIRAIGGDFSTGQPPAAIIIVRLRTATTAQKRAGIASTRRYPAFAAQQPHASGSRMSLGFALPPDVFRTWGKSRKATYHNLTTPAEHAARIATLGFAGASAHERPVPAGGKSASVSGDSAAEALSSVREEIDVRLAVRAFVRAVPALHGLHWQQLDCALAKARITLTLEDMMVTYRAAD
jgi:hypothetical protein